MKHIAKFLKPFLIGVIVTIGLLFVQAMADLNLPNYMSDIVDVGISKSGIDHSSPENISEQGFLFMQNFMTQDEKDLLNESYTLKENKDFDNFDADKIYYRKENIDIEKLDNAFSYASWTIINFLQDMGSQSDETSTDKEMKIDVIELYNITPMLQVIPAEKLDDYKETAREIDVMLASQTGTAFTAGFYEELGVNLADTQFSYLVRVGLLMLLIALIGGGSTILVSFITSKISAGVARNLREQLFNKINSFSNEEYDKFSTSSLITRSTNDVQQVQMLCMMGLRMIFYCPIMLIGGVIMAINKSASMAWILALSCGLIIMFVCTIMYFVMPKFKIMQKLIDKINLVSRETLNGLMVIKAFGTSEFEKDRFDKANENYAKNNLFVNKVMSGMFPFMTLVMNGTSLLIVWIGASQIADSAIQVGDMMAYIQYAMQVIMSFLMISMMFVFLPRAIVSAQRINEVLETKPSIVDPTNAKEFIKSKKGEVEFKNVYFKYHGADEYALENISFTAKPGQTVAFIGSTGSGKSTIVNLIPRFYDVDKGEVLIEGVNVKDTKQHDLHKKIGYVPQKSILMSGTINSNIKYGNQTMSDEDMIISAKVSQSADFINEKEEKYDTFIAQGGSNVSGGQRQRLSIARALATKAPIYVFDDSFSALDYKTDVTLRQALKENTSDATVIIIAQRVGTILDADIIHVLNEGKIVGTGTHKELLKSCESYYEIASTQLSKEELENE